MDFKTTWDLLKGKLREVEKKKKYIWDLEFKLKLAVKSF